MKTYCLWVGARSAAVCRTRKPFTVPCHIGKRVPFLLRRPITLRNEGAAFLSPSFFLPPPIRPNLHPPIIGPLLSALWRMPPIALISAAEPEEANLLPDASVKFLPYPIDRANVTKRNWKLSEVSLPGIVGMSPTRTRIDQNRLVQKNDS